MIYRTVKNCSDSPITNISYDSTYTAENGNMVTQGGTQLAFRQFAELRYLVFPCYSVLFGQHADEPENRVRLGVPRIIQQKKRSRIQYLELHVGVITILPAGFEKAVLFSKGK